ncbi:hypothetical protein Tco_0400047 [Tanacetum coccineum]
MLEEEKAHRRGKVYNWETDTYGKIWYDEDVHDLRFVETKFPAIFFNDAFTSEVMLSYEPTVSPLTDNKADFRMPFDESDDEDYTPTVSYFDDLDYFKDFEKEFPAIVYNDGLTSKLDFLTEPSISPQHVDEFNLKDETSLSKFFGSIVYTTYSLNEYSVFDTSINTAYPGEWIWRIDFLYSLRILLNINDEFGGVLTFWNACVLLSCGHSDAFSTHILSH